MVNAKDLDDMVAIRALLYSLDNSIVLSSRIPCLYVRRLNLARVIDELCEISCIDPSASVCLTSLNHLWSHTFVNLFACVT